jgi:hypothetical protein
LARSGRPVKARSWPGPARARKKPLNPYYDARDKSGPPCGAEPPTQVLGDVIPILHLVETRAADQLAVLVLLLLYGEQVGPLLLLEKFQLVGRLGRTPASECPGCATPSPFRRLFGQALSQTSCHLGHLRRLLPQSLLVRLRFRLQNRPQLRFEVLAQNIYQPAGRPPGWARKLKKNTQNIYQPTGRPTTNGGSGEDFNPQSPRCFTVKDANRYGSSLYRVRLGLSEHIQEVKMCDPKPNTLACFGRWEGP